ncbi:MAG: PKD domain-containing protein [Methanolinea sp.]|jgi:PKD repeat protein|nr:PKD domain-containing protein [Methanolinea sp.]
MEKRDMAILLLALGLVVVMGIVVKPILTGKSPDLSLPGFFQETDSPPSTPQVVLPPSTPVRTTVHTPTPSLTWNGTPMDLGYVSVGTPTPPHTLSETSISPGYAPAVTTETTPSPIPGLLTASFTAMPREGPLPLHVQFTDTSIGIPDRWAWSFGDGTTSSLQNPRHTYTREGSYQVSLMVQNARGGNTRISQGYILVTTAEEEDVVIEGQRGAKVVPGGFIEFTVIKPGSSIKIRGHAIDLPEGTRIRLVVEDEGKGKISVQGGSIKEYTFGQVTLYIDETLKERGMVHEILVHEYGGFISSIDLDIAGGSDNVRILENGVPVYYPDEQSPLSLISLRPDSSGVMILDCYWPESMYFKGAVTSYYIS